MTATILIVDDEPDLLHSIELTLTAADYRVLTAADGKAALAALENEAVDIIIADVAMPELNGYQLLERVRQNPAWHSIPVIFLTARKMDSDIRYGKSLGVDDYLTKPIHRADLLAVIEGKLRRREQLAQLSAQSASATDEPVLEVGPLQIDTVQHRVWLTRQEISLSPREFALLEHLARQPKRPVSVEELVKITHNLETDRQEASLLVRSLVHSLRRKLGTCIENVRGIGYRLSFPND
jgi:DNA-binding response OmpR family regulator